MPGPPPAVAVTRVAVRAQLRRVLDEVRGESGSAPRSDPSGRTGPVPAPFAAPAPHRRTSPLVLVACSGGADSLALAAALAFEAPRLGVRAGAVVVDHGLQAGSAGVAATAAAACAALGLAPVEITTVRMNTGPRAATAGVGGAAGADATGSTPATPLIGAAGANGAGGPEARARQARYSGLDRVADRLGAAAVLLGHTRDDQAEQVLLGLARGSGSRSLAGMPAVRGRYRRPFLAISRDDTVAACAAQDLTPWRDPHNADDRYRRVRARGLLARAERELGPGIGAALARTADLLRADADALDALADDARAELGEPPWPVAALAAQPRALRARLWIRLAGDCGAPPGRLTSRHVDALDALVTSWRGQGPVVLPGGIRVGRDRDTVRAPWPTSG